MTNTRHDYGSQMARSFAELLSNAMKKAKINDKTLAESIDLENTLGEGISDRTVARWRRGEKNRKGELYQPKERRHVLDMIKPLGFARRGQQGLKECNQLLCEASIYRCAVPETFWLSHLEDWDYNDEQQKRALETLRERYLVETEINAAHQLLLRQHNLIRSVALECLTTLGEEEITNG